ncbi:hypothetical protein BJ875DRAFT_488553 [Amylocarpus encephaloides]|uniref:Enoyl reductase (ER) domain-containing protein n=1 Tax=Amylocarpus encephaloides TaxID=45428 RepID=A0A9P7YAQ5_9HELO|nr:hypothetical protein BJ875DRAFT_488553 [Amylocarpus encephaloides]
MPDNKQNERHPLDKVGGDYHLFDNLDRPKPGQRQLLVKSLVAGLNPVEGFQLGGILVDSWPMVLGCDASGIIVEIGDEFLMDSHLSFKEPENISREEAATIGVGVLTAGLALFGGLKLSLDDKADNSEWIVILGTTGAVGQHAVQVKGIASITNGNFVRHFDASAMAGELGMQALADHGAKDKTKYFATTNDWEPVKARDEIEIDMVALGLIGKSGTAEAEMVNSAIEGFIPKLEELFKAGGLRPMKY